MQLIYSLFSQPIENVLHVLSGGGVLVADMDRIEGVIAAWWTATGRAKCSLNLSLVRIVADALNVENGLHKEYTTGWTATGNDAAASAPGQNTMAIKLATGFSGRSFRGRVFWPGIPANQIVSGLLTAGYRDGTVVAFNTLRTNLAAGGDQLAVVSYCHDGAWRANAVVTPVTNVSAKTTLCQQKRRRVAGA